MKFAVLNEKTKGNSSKTLYSNVEVVHKILHLISGCSHTPSPHPENYKTLAKQEFASPEILLCRNSTCVTFTKVNQILKTFSQFFHPTRNLINEED